MQLNAITTFTHFHEVGLQINGDEVARNVSMELLAYSQLHLHHEHIQMWVAVNEKDNAPLARILLFYKPAEPHIAYWGWYQASSQLNSKHFWEVLAKKQQLLGANRLVGPLLGTTWFEYRYKITPTAPLVYGEPSHVPLYLNQLQQAGFKEWKKFNTAWSTSDKIKVKPLSTLSERLHQKGLSFEYITPELEVHHLAIFHQLTTLCFKGRSGFGEIDFNVYQLLMKGLGSSMDRSLSFAFMWQGQPIAYLITQYLVGDSLALTTNKENCRALRNFAVAPTFRNKGLGLLLSDFFHTLCVEKNIHTFIYALMSAEDLSDRAAAKLLDAQPLAHYALFEKAC